FILATIKKWMRYLNKSVRFIYTLYVWLLFVILMLPAWLLVLIASKKVSAKIIRLWAKLLVKLSFCSVKVKNKTNLFKERPVIFAANHSSYIDSIILLSILPAGVLFIGKKELQKWPIVSSAMKKLNFITVDRWDFS